MGNQQTCCIQQQDRGEIQSYQKKSIKYAKRISVFETSQKNFHDYEMKSENSKILKNIKPNEEKSSSIIFQKITQKDQKQKCLSKIDNKTVSVNCLPIVNKVIKRQNPYAKQFSSIPQYKIKTILINQDDLYHGEIDYYQKPHGYGTLFRENGNAMLGKYNHGVNEGKMLYVFKDGSYYKGQILQGKANDTSGEFHSLKMTYIGGFLNNLFNGKGKQMGELYYFEGEYQNSLKKYGKYCWRVKDKRDKKQRKLQQSTEKQEIPPVRDFTTIPSFDFQYQGAFDENQKFTGVGRLRDPHGEYIGNFVQGMKHGKGEYDFASKLRYVGDYFRDKKSGYGRLFNCDNTLAYEGQWKDDLPDGKGCSFDFKGNKNQSEFVKGISKVILPQNQ